MTKKQAFNAAINFNQICNRDYDTENRQIKIVHNKLLGGWYVVRGPHQTPLSGRFDSKAEAKASLEKKRK
jgi:hypothetical protein